MTPLEAALAYASWGWPVLPIVPNGKLPATQHGVNDATTDEATIRRWFEGHDDRNVGIACGAASGLVVFDIDPRNGGALGFYRHLGFVDLDASPDVVHLGLRLARE